MDFRVEADTLGDVSVPSDAYYGAQTQRALDNFKVSSLRLQFSFIKAQAIIKIAAAKSNAKSGGLDISISEAIIKAAREVIKGEYSKQFGLDVCDRANRSALQEIGLLSGDYG